MLIEQYPSFIKKEGERIELKEERLRGFIQGLGYPQAVSERMVNATVEFFQDLTEQISGLFEERDELSESVDILQKQTGELKEELKTTQDDLGDEVILQILGRIAGIERVDITSEQWREIGYIRKDLES